MSERPLPPGDHVPAVEPHELHALVGGDVAFHDLVEAFYARVAVDPLLRPLYPEDLEPGKRHLALFFIQYWGGGDHYARQRGHPRLRMRHAPFAISPEVAARWAVLMSEAVREQGWPAAAESLMLTYVTQATPTLINRFPDHVVPPSGGAHPGG